MAVKDFMTTQQRAMYTYWGIAWACYHFIGIMFRCEKLYVKALEYSDKRWNLLTSILKDITDEYVEYEEEA